MQRNLVLALHGFLGQGSDWNTVKKEFVQGQALAHTHIHAGENSEWLTPDLFNPDSMWVLPYDQFCDALVDKYNVQLSGFTKRIFIGYSLGGRLGLHLLKKYATLFDHFIFVSTHPGLTTVAEKDLRKESDAKWALQITESNWTAFFNDWNAQPVLESETEDPVREINNFNLAALQSSLSTWSLAQQADLTDLIRTHQQKITWAVGTKDTKFLKIAEDLEQKKILLNVSRILSGHRILFENPKELASILLHQLS